MRHAGHLLVALLLSGISLAAEGPLPPLDSVRLLRQARILDMVGQTDAARERLQQAVEMFPDELAPLVELVGHYERHGTSPEELARLRLELAERVGNLDGALPQSTLAYLSLNPDMAPEERELTLIAIRTRLQTEPDDLALLQAMATLEESLGRPEQAYRAHLRILAIEPSPELLLRAVDHERETGDWASAAKHLRQVLDDYHDSPIVKLVYIGALGKAGEYEELLQALETLIEWAKQADSDGPETDLGRAMRQPLGSVLFEAAWEFRDQGRDHEAETLFRRVLALDPDHRGASQTVHYFYSSDEERQAHQAELEAKLAEQSDPYLLLDEGGKRLASGDVEAAFELLGRAVAGLPDNEAAVFNLGLAALQLERWSAAEQAFERATELNPNRAQSFVNLGIAVRQQDRLEEAVALFEQALNLEADNSQAHFFLGQTYLVLGKRDEAQTHLERYQALSDQ